MTYTMLKINIIDERECLKKGIRVRVRMRMIFNHQLMNAKQDPMHSYLKRRLNNLIHHTLHFNMINN